MKKLISKIINYLKGIIVIDENEKASTIILTLLIFVGLGSWSFITSNPHTLDSNLSTTIIALSGVVAGLNIGNSIVNKDSENSIDTTTSSEDTTIK